MKILYGINSNGQGHINRSRIFISELQKDGHEVHILFAGKKPPEYAHELAEKTLYKKGAVDLYNNHKVAITKTLSNHFVRLPIYAKTRKEVLELDRKENYDAFFTDFESSTSVVGRKLRKPVISIDHQHSIFHPKAKKAPGKFYDKLGLLFVFIYMIPHYNRAFTLDFVTDIKTSKKCTLFPLIWKPEFNRYDIRLGSHYVAYLARHDPQKITAVLNQIPHETFHVYGFDRDKQIGNVIFKKTSREGFLQDLANAKAVIGNAGFSLTWETCIINKLIWIMPHKHQFEQETNAHRLKTYDRAYVSEKLTVEDFYAFSEWAESKNFKPEKKLSILPASELMERAYNYLERYRSENFLSRREKRKRIRREISPWRLRQNILRDIRINP
ncbi:MAG: glycosyltransferase family protein [Asgard group archaeon]|nr:glycosyltransferase family protein [Asgard group archaeon]